MIQVTFEQTDTFVSIRLKGHAGYAKDGPDIVCAAASMLAYTAAQNAMNLYSNDELLDEPIIKLLDGDIYVGCKPDPDMLDAVACVFQVILNGFLLLGKNYPEHVRVEQIGNG